MTIFLMVVKKLIKDHLNSRANDLLNQSKGLFATLSLFNSKLSKAQKGLIDDLDTYLVLFKGTGDDEVDYKEIIAYIEKTRENVQDVRETHKANRNSGETITCLNDLILHIKDFYSKLNSYKFSLLNREYTKNPEGIVYYYAAYYFGEDKFTPRTNVDSQLRILKEELLRARLQTLSELIRPEFLLEDRRSRTLRVLQDLDSDNKKVIHGDGTSLPVPGVNFWGVQANLSTDVFSPGEGSMGELFKAAAQEIIALTPETFQGAAEIEVESPKQEVTA